MLEQFIAFLPPPPPLPSPNFSVDFYRVCQTSIQFSFSPTQAEDWKMFLMKIFGSFKFPALKNSHLKCKLDFLLLSNHITRYTFFDAAVPMQTTIFKEVYVQI